MGHHWSKSIVTDCQKIVTYFRNSHQPNAFLENTSKILNISNRLKSSNTTRITSVYLSIQSVQANECSIKQVCQQNQDIIKNKEVKRIIASRLFWSNLEVLCNFLEPFSKVITSIQSNFASLADVTRYWVFLTKSIEKRLEEFPTEFAKHVIFAFNKRTLEMSLPTTRLALFLDPRYRKACDDGDNFKSIVLAGLEIMHSRKYGSRDLMNLKNQLLIYRTFSPPYSSVSFGGSNF